MTFSALIAAAKRHDCGLELAVPSEWHQGRTAYGGFSAAAALVAAMEVGGEGLPPLRSAVVGFVGPAFGDIDARARVLRRGKNATWIGADLVRAGEVVVTATFVFMGPVASSVHLNDCPPPQGLIAPEQAGTYKPHSLMPAFISNNFDVAFALPKLAEKRPDLCWWVRLKDRAGIDPMVEMMLIADCLPPGVLPLMGPGTPVSSMTWQSNLLTAAPVTRDGWWLLRSTGDYAEDGCSSQVMRMWNADGQPVMAGMQAIALFG
ncbi:MAG: thioesterase family protein [Novosphingobium sp.]